MANLKFNENILKDYAEINEMIIKSKFYFLQVIQFSTIEESTKDNLRNALLDISKSISLHFNTIKYAKITKYNIFEYEKNEKNYLKDLTKEINYFIKKCNRISPVKLNRKIDISIKLIDQDIFTSHIYGTRALEIDIIKNLNLFNDYLVNQLTYKTETPIHNDPKSSSKVDIDKDLFELKMKTFIEKINYRNPKNPEVFYKIKSIIENTLNKKKVNIYPFELINEQDNYNNDELYIFFDNSYNFKYIYRIDSKELFLDLSIIKQIDTNNITFSDSIFAKGNLGINEAIAIIPFNKELLKTPFNTFNNSLNNLLNDLDLASLYFDTFNFVKKHQDDILNKESKQQQKIIDDVSKSLDDLL